jgi:ATP-binding cassette subfamily B protein
MFKDIMILLGDNKKKLNTPILLMILDSITNMVFFGMLYNVLTDLMNAGLNKHKLLVYGLVMLTAFIMRCIIVSIGHNKFYIEGAKAVKAMRISLGDHLRNLNLGYFNKNSIGDLSNIMTNDIQDFEHILTHSMVDLIKTISLSVYILIIGFIIDSKLALIQLIIILISMPIIYMGGVQATKIGVKKKTVLNEVISRMVEYIDGIKVFRAYNLIGDKFERLEKSFRDLKKESIRTEVAIAPFVLLFSIVVDIGYPIILLSASYRLIAGTIEKDSFLIFVIMSLALTNVLKAFSMHYTQFKYLKLASKKILDTYNQPEISYNEENLQVDNYDIEFRDVSFEYEDNEQVLKDISFLAKEGTMTALIGPSGSGKTTVTSLIARFWDVNRGMITVGGKNIKDISPDELLSYISMVFQDVYLLNDTIYNNIKVGNQNAVYEEIVNAAKIANCHDFIEQLPGKYDTMVGEGGSTLSGGEKQRISLARAILKDAPIILLDEATASLDADNEMEIRKSINELIENKTVIVIAHRLNTIKGADQIIVLNDGKIEEKGNHYELLKIQGRYYHMYNEMEKAKSWSI